MLISLWLNEKIRLSSLTTYMTLIMWYQGVCNCRHMYIYMLSRIGFQPSARMRREGYSSRSVCTCLSVYNYSRTTSYEAAYERYQQLQCYKGKKVNVAILLKRLRSRDMA